MCTHALLKFNIDGSFKDIVRTLILRRSIASRKQSRK